MAKYLFYVSNYHDSLNRIERKYYNTVWFATKVLRINKVNEIVFYQVKHYLSKTLNLLIVNFLPVNNIYSITKLNWQFIFNLQYANNF